MVALLPHFLPLKCYASWDVTKLKFQYITSLIMIHPSFYVNSSDFAAFLFRLILFVLSLPQTELQKGRNTWTIVT